MMLNGPKEKHDSYKANSGWTTTKVADWSADNAPARQRAIVKSR